MSARSLKILLTATQAMIIVCVVITTLIGTFNSGSAGETLAIGFIGVAVLLSSTAISIRYINAIERSSSKRDEEKEG